MDFGHGESGSSKHSRTRIEAKSGEDDSSVTVQRLGQYSSSAKSGEDDSSVTVQRLRQFSSSTSSSSSNSSLDDFFRTGATEEINLSTCLTASPDPSENDYVRLALIDDDIFLSKPNKNARQTLIDGSTFSPKPDGGVESTVGDDFTASPKPDVLLELGDDESDVSSKTSSKSEEHDKESSVPASPLPVSDLTHESLSNITTPTQSPPIQMMERSGGYEPDRIPSSVFARSKSITPMDWSVASNESLFSIHVGNNSFSRDHVFALGGEAGRFGDLGRSGDFIMINPTLSTEGEGDGNSIDSEKKLGATGVAEDGAKDLTTETLDDQSDERIPPPQVSWNSSSLSRNSDGSGASTRSFAFPIKLKRAWPSCYCSNCSWAFCYCTWPSCYCRWPSFYCSKCSWAFCYCWNRSKKRFCSFSSMILTGRAGSMRTEHAQKPPQNTKVKSRTASKKWFPCFSCLSCSSCFSHFPCFPRHLDCRRCCCCCCSCCHCLRCC